MFAARDSLAAYLMYILGINAYHGDAAAAIVGNGELIAAVEEERFNRIKHCAGFPSESIKYCLRAAGIDIEQVDHVGISRNPSANLHKKILFAAKRFSHRGAEAESKAERAKSKASGADLSPSFAVETMGTDETASSTAHYLLWPSPANGNGNGHGKRFLQQVTDRLRNAAKVRDIKSELANALEVSAAGLRAYFHNIEHHRAHLASAFFVSPFERAALLSIDGFGDFVSTMWAIGKENSIEVLGQVEYPHSLGIVYTATTQFLGFPHYGDEGKVMGLAPYGQPRFIDQFREIVRAESHGQFVLNLDYFRHTSEGVDMTWEGGSPRVGRLFSNEYENIFGAARKPDAPLTNRDRDVAASLQLRLEEVAFHVLNHLHEQTGLTDLGLAGGVAYNSVMNGKILQHTPFRRVFVQPAAGDSGTAIGVCYQILNEQRARSKAERVTNRSSYALSSLLVAPFTGPEFSNHEIAGELKRSNLKFETLSDGELTDLAARDIADGLIVGWFQGRMEFGPRALGNRSILADPRREEMKDILNARVKRREPFRPFAPSILEEHIGDYFVETHPSPAMLMVYGIKPDGQREIPAVTHVDGSGRLQTVTREANERYYDLIEQFYKLTGVPIVLNTSFNENEPVVCTPRDAIECFLKTKIDVLYLGNHMVRR